MNKLEVSEPIKKHNETSISRHGLQDNNNNTCLQKHYTLYSYLTLTLTSNAQDSCAGFRATNNQLCIILSYRWN